MLNTIKVAQRFRSIPSIRFYTSCAQSLNDLGFKRTTYTDEQTSKILKVVNNSSLLDLKNYQISHQRIQRILKRRQIRGNFGSIEDILEVDGFGIKILEKFCNSILNATEKSAPEENPTESLSNTSLKQQVESGKRQQFISPAMLEIIRSKIRSVISFHVDLNYFAWTKFYFDRTSNDKLGEPKFFVESWNCHEFPKQDKNLRLTDLIELLVKISDQIPQADVYVMEALPATVQAKQPGSALQINVNVQKTQLVSMLGALMASRHSTYNLISDSSEIKSEDHSNETPYFDSVYFLRNFLPSRLYKILIGNERVSAANVIDQIIAYNYTMHNNFDPTYASIDISEQHRIYWNKSSRIQQEYLGSSMLVGLTFLKLCVERCQGSLESLNTKIQKS